MVLQCYTYTSVYFLSKKNHIAERILSVTTIINQSNLMNPAVTENNNAGSSVAIEAIIAQAE